MSRVVWNRREVQWPVGALFLAALLALAALNGCGGHTRPAAVRPQRLDDTQSDLIRSVADSINRLEEFDSREMIPQVRDRLNQWITDETPRFDWRRDPLVAALPAEFAALDDVKNLDSVQYSQDDVRDLQSAVWLRDISRRVQAGAFDDLETAERLFDWTVRNLQLSPDAAGDPPLIHSPREILLLSRATAEERAWVFALLARQCGLNVVTLALPQPDGRPPRLWASALLRDRDLFLFDPRLGLPAPGPGGKGIATLAQAAADDALLRALDLDAQRRYPVAAGDLKNIVPWIEASPDYLAKRMKLIEMRLAGANRVTLSVAPTALAARLAEIPHLAPAALWPLAYRMRYQRAHLDLAAGQALGKDLFFLQLQPQLISGRALEFKGAFDGPDGARRLLMSARPSDLELRDVRLKPEARAAVENGKQNATFWLGMIAFEERDYPLAIDFFSKRMMAEAPGGILFPAAQYNLARAYEASGQPAKAIDLYNDDDSPQRHGNRLRARRLSNEAAAK